MWHDGAGVRIIGTMQPPHDTRQFPTRPEGAGGYPYDPAGDVDATSAYPAFDPRAAGPAPAAGRGLSAGVKIAIALVVLLPETLAAARNAKRRRVQIGLNLALGSAMASIGLTIPAMAIMTLFIDTPLVLGLDPVQIVLLALTASVSILTVMPGRATRLQASIHLVLGVAFVFLAAIP